MSAGPDPAPARPPTVSIVIPVLDDAPVLLDCLAALSPESDRRDDTEVLVVDASGRAGDLVGDRFPRTRVVAHAGPPSVPSLRGRGIAAARGAIVALLDPDCLVRQGWITAAVKLHADPRLAAVGGGVTLDPDRAGYAARVAYLFDYWEFIPPVPDGPTKVLPGANIVYKRACLPDSTTLERHGFWKAFFNRGLGEEADRLLNSSALTVHMRRSPRLGRFLRSRYRYGRSYAAMRVETASVAVRVLRALTTPMLPVLFLARQMQGLAAKPGTWGWFLVCAPCLMTAHVIWAWGELWGYLAGPGGHHDAIGY